MSQKEDFSALDERTRELLRLLIRTYIMSGEPVGSRTLSQFIDGNPANGEVIAVSGANGAGYVNLIWATNFDNADEDRTQIAWYIDGRR